MEEDKILENITKSISEKLKVPIIVTYLSVLVLYNWDILYFLLFENAVASCKIQIIKETYGSLYFQRIFICLLIAVILISLFTVLNTLITFCLKWFYRKDKEISSEIESYEKLNVITEQLSNSIDTIKNLNSQIVNLKNINESLLSKNLNIDVLDISKNDYDRLLKFLNTKSNKEKLLFSLKELIDKLKLDINTRAAILYKTATYEADMRELINYLVQMKLINVIKKREPDASSFYDAFELGTSFKDFLKMEV